MPPKPSLPKPSSHPPKVGDAIGGYAPPGFRATDAIRSFGRPDDSIRSQEAAYNQAWQEAAERDRNPRVPGRPATSSTTSTSGTLFTNSTTTSTEKPTINGIRK